MTKQRIFNFIYKILPFFIFFILIIIPFSWLKPGEMDLGGDSSRLYFYDPINYLKSHSLYASGPSGLGGEVIGYSGIPYIVLLYILKMFFSSTFIINLDHGIALGIAFLFVYFIVKEFSSFIEVKKISETDICLAAITAGLFYSIGPGLIFGWDKVIITHSQVFINPLMFFLMYKFIVTRSMKILFVIIFISFLFSQNFGVSSIAPFLAFYPVSTVFLLLYIKKIVKKNIPWQHLALLFFLLIGTGIFHLFPSLVNSLSPGSPNFNAAFTTQGIIIRGLDYFIGISNVVKVSIHLMNLPQQVKIQDFYWLFVIFPLITVAGLYWNRGKSLSLTALFFIPLFFIATANITSTLFWAYSLLFRIPGFAMFRNYYGQWQYAFIFFYAILFGQAFTIVLFKLSKKKIAILLFLVLTGIIIYGSFPLLNGAIVNKTLYQTKDVKIPIVMDPEYKNALNYIRNLPVDGKILTLPLADPGYQVLSGLNGGAYQGPSTISYLTGKKDFIGYDDLGIFAGDFLSLARNNDYKGIRRILSLLNIKYIFYNSDAKIYNNTFPQFPYTHVRESMPETQAAYKKFIENLGVSKQAEFGKKYTIYGVNNIDYLPHIYSSTYNTVYNNNDSLLLSNRRQPAYVNINLLLDDNKQYIISGANEIFLEAENRNPLRYIKDNSHLLEHQPFVSTSIGNIFYPLILLKEKYDLHKKMNIPEDYVDESLYLLSKRIFELTQEGNILPIKSDKKGLSVFKSYYSWNSEFDNYFKQEQALVMWITNSNQVEDWKVAMDEKLKEQIFFHKKRLINYITSISNIDKTKDEKGYLLSKVNTFFDNLIDLLSSKQFDLQSTQYSLDLPNNLDGEYEIYLDNDFSKADLQQLSLDIGNKKTKPGKNQNDSNFIQFDDVYIKSGQIPVVLHYPMTNLLNNTTWQSDGSIWLQENEKNIVDDNILQMKFDNVLKTDLGGFTREIKNWLPNNQYIVTFDYKTEGDSFFFRLYEKNHEKTFDDKSFSFKTEDGFSLTSEKVINSDNWKKFQEVLSGNLSVKQAAINIFPLTQNGVSALEIRNLSVVRVPYPKIYFRKILPAKINNANPKITFTKINPTKYLVQIDNVKNPYTLIFLDAFNKNWKLFDINRHYETIKGSLYDFIGNVAKIIVDIFMKNHNNNNQIVVQYFNGDVSEGVHSNVFLEPNTFNTWGKTAIAQNTHFMVNGYANGWIIYPKDMDNKSNYTLILEMGTQRYFYFFLGVSILTIVGVFLYLIFRLIKK